MASEQDINNLDVRNWLPHGDQLRVLLSSDHVSLGEVAALARRKGLFASGLDKARLIQFLSTSLILPEEFESLLEASVSRESKPKDQPQDVPLTSLTADWQSKVKEVGKELGDLVRLNDVLGTSFTSDPQVSIVEKDRLLISYEISRVDYSKDFLHREMKFRGEISITQDGGALNLRVVSRHTAKETGKINDQILKHVVQSLKDAGVTREDSPRKILFGAFTNKNRVVFLLRIAADSEISSSPGQICDLNIKPNEARAGLIPIPELKIFEGSIRNMRMDGSKLNELLLLTDDSFYDHIFLTRVSVDYDFTIGIYQGCCSVTFYFQIPKNTAEMSAAPLSFSIESISQKKGSKITSLQGAKKAVNQAIHLSVDRHYKALRSI